MVVLPGILDKDVDLLEVSIDRKADAPSAVDDRERAIFLRDGRRLEDADRFDAGGKRCVRHFAGLDFSGIAGILLQGAGIDASQFHLISPVFISSKVFLDDETWRARAIRPGQRRRVSAGIRPA